MTFNRPKWAKEERMTDTSKLRGLLARTRRQLKKELGEFQRISCGSPCCNMEELYYAKVDLAIRTAITALQDADQWRMDRYEAFDRQETEKAGMEVQQ
jgi:hypothetical protein